MAADSLDGRYDFENGVATAGPEIQNQCFRAIIRHVKRGDVSRCEIGYVDEIAFASPIGGRVIRAEDLQWLTAPGCGIDRKRYEMSFGIVPFAKLSV